MSVPTELFDAAASGDAGHVRGLLATHPEIVNAPDADGATALHHSALFGHREIVTRSWRSCARAVR